MVVFPVFFPILTSNRGSSRGSISPARRKAELAKAIAELKESLLLRPAEDGSALITEGGRYIGYTDWRPLVLPVLEQELKEI